MIRDMARYFLLAALCAPAAVSSAAVPNEALLKPIISGSGVYPADPFNTGQFRASNVTNGVYTEPNSGAPTYWLGREGVVNENFVVDLLSPTVVEEIRLRNTHNGFCNCNDRSTANFQIFGSNTVDGLNQLVDPQLVVVGTLPRVDNMNVVPSTGFNASNGLNPGTYRYLQFQALSTTQVPTNVGLNEFEVYSKAEPNVALGKPIVDGSGSYDGAGTGVIGTFGTYKVTDGRLDDKDYVGTTLPSYWLGRERVNNEWFVVDLEAVKEITRIDLQNTTNRQFLDRGTDAFNIQVSTAGPAGPWIPLLDGNLSGPSALVHPNARPFDIFEFPATEARWIRFEAETYIQPNPTCCTGAGLSEMFVYGAVDNLALHNPLIKTSGEYQFAPAFNAANVTDGSTTDEFQYSYWLGREGTTNESFTVDLGALYNLDEIHLRNTHNEVHNDRGTDEFVVYGATAVDGNNDLVDPFVLATGNLTNVNGQTNLTTDVFGVTGAARYVQFVALTANNLAGNVGLNEIEVYGSPVPEPSTFALAGMAGIAVLWRLRRKSVR
jgi:hypothetical protein